MDSQWQPYKDPLAGRPAQFNNNGLTSNPNPQQVPSKYGGQPQPPSQPPVGYTYEAFQNPGIAAKPPSITTNSKSASMASSPAATPHSRDYVTDADTIMEDADPYNRSKYSTRSNHQSRPSSQYFPSEESSAARRYSPMNVLSPTLPYNSSPGKSGNSYAFPPATNQSGRSPTRTANYSSPPQSFQSPPCKS
jgi:dual specificity protein kinase YAK1